MYSHFLLSRTYGTPSGRLLSKLVGLKTLARTLRATSELGTRQALLLLGNGIHLQAAREAGLSDPDPWLLCLRRIAEESGVQDFDRLPRWEPLLWDALVTEVAAAQHLPPQQAHGRLRERLIQRLDLIERARQSLPLFGRILNLRFENILSLNIDRTLALHGAREVFVKGESWQLDPTFHRHSLVPHADGVATRVWYINGDTRNSEVVCLGTTNHPAQLMSLENQRAPMMNDWVEYRVASWSYPGAQPHTKLKTPAKFYERCRRRPTSWYPFAFVAPLIIIGARLPLEDWPMWWLLHQRARNLIPFPEAEIPPTFFLTAKGEDIPQLAYRPAEIEVVEFPSYDVLWEFVLR